MGTDPTDMVVLLYCSNGMEEAEADTPLENQPSDQKSALINKLNATPLGSKPVDELKITVDSYDVMPVRKQPLIIASLGTFKAKVLKIRHQLLQRNKELAQRSLYEGPIPDG